MITPADDFLIHQTPYPIETVATTDRNFYDRYFFNGYRRDGEVYFAVAMGSYPNMGVFDCAFAVVHKGKERFVRASRALGSDRMDAAAGPIRVEIVEPLKKVRVTVTKNQWGIEADLLFEARSLPSEEPHFYRRGSLGSMDYTRMTQHGTWTGTLTLDGTTFDLSEDTWWGSRDHSWGIRGIGGRDPRGAPPSQAPQFYWNWAPVNFDDLCTLYTVSEHSDGSRWHESGVILRPYPDARETDASVSHSLKFQKGTRYIGKGSKVTLTPPTGDPLVLEFEPQYHFLMQGIGYGEPKWGHGMWVGANEVDGGEYDLATANPMEHLHVQTVSQVTAGNRKGIGIFEIIVLGAYPSYGFDGLLDMAK